MTESVEALETALAFEQRARDFYREAAAQTGDPVLQAVLRQLAEDEEGHVNAVRRMHASIGDGDQPPDAETGHATLRDDGRQLEDLVRGAEQAVTSSEATFIGRYEAALEMERKASEFYREHAAAASGSGAAEFMAAMANVEQLHVGMIQRVLDANRRC